MAFLRSEYNFSKRYTGLRDPTIPPGIENVLPWPGFGPSFFRELWLLEPVLQCAQSAKAGNVSNFPREITETALAHVIGDKAGSRRPPWRRTGEAAQAHGSLGQLLRAQRTRKRYSNRRTQSEKATNLGLLNRSSQSGPNRYPVAVRCHSRVNFGDPFGHVSPLPR
jgi:hypothetical protein